MISLGKSRSGNPWNLKDNAAYSAWRSEKLSDKSALSGALNPVEISDISAPSTAEKNEIVRRCAATNGAVYATQSNPNDSNIIREQLSGFSKCMGLDIAERHRSAGQAGIVALQLDNAKIKRGYIPYSKRPMNWHTDGYYNAPQEKIRAMILHCVHPADDGGENQLMDPEIVFIRLRDENPDYISALMHPAAMTIPENRQENGEVRPASVGPVFEINETSGNLEMRYTARTRSIQWRQDVNTQQATKYLTELLQSGDPFMQNFKMEAGQGILCNNSLHNRTGFDSQPTVESKRLLFRIRFHNRVLGS